MRAHRFIHQDNFVRRRAFGFEHMPCFSRKSKQVFVHEAPWTWLMQRYDTVTQSLLTPVFVTSYKLWASRRHHSKETSGFPPVLYRPCGPPGFSLPPARLSVACLFILNIYIYIFLCTRNMIPKTVLRFQPYRQIRRHLVVNTWTHKGWEVRRIFHHLNLQNHSMSTCQQLTTFTWHVTEKGSKNVHRHRAAARWWGRASAS